MIALDIAFDRVDPAAWRNALALAFPPSRTGVRRPPPSPLVLFIEDNRCIKALRPGTGRLDPSQFSWSGPASLDRLRRAARAPFAIAFVDDALDRVAQAIERNVPLDGDLVAQWLAAASAVRAELGRGIHLDPDPIGRVPVPSFAALQKTWDALVPDDRSVALFVFDGGAPWTSLVVEKQSGHAVRVTTHAALDLESPSLRRHREILDALARAVARPHAALFCTLDAWREIAGPDGGALARHVAAGSAILDPAPPWAVALVGAGAVAGVAQSASRLLGRFVPDSIKATARAVSPFAALGFDPIELFVRIKKIFG